MTSKKSINTRNESTLHKTLKTLYSLEEGSRTEVSLDGKMYDVIDANGDIIEIQTQNVSALRKKIENALMNRRTISVVYPVARTKTVESYTINGELVRSKKSPLHLSVYSMWKEITGLAQVLLQPGVTLEVLEIDMTEKRLLFDAPIQYGNRCRHWYKTWLKVDKRLDKIYKAHTFSTANSYLALLPVDCPAVFCAKDVANILEGDKTLPPSASKQANYMLYVLSRMGLIELATPMTAKRGRGKTKYYKRLFR